MDPQGKLLSNLFHANFIIETLQDETRSQPPSFLVFDPSPSTKKGEFLSRFQMFYLLNGV